MKFSVASGALAKINTPCLIVGQFQAKSLQGDLATVDKAVKGALTKLVKSGDLSGRLGQCEMFHCLEGIAAKRLLVVGLGEEAKFTALQYRKANLNANKRLNAASVSGAVNTLPGLPVADRDPTWRLGLAARIAGECAYRYTETVKPKASSGKPPASMRFLAGQARNTDKLKLALKHASGVVAGVNLCRRLGDLPPNICTPEFLATEASKLAKRHKNLRIKVLDKKALLKMGAGALMGVAQGSHHDPRLIVFQYQGTAKSKAPHALVGKGVCFDSGGISIKPGAMMDEMKYDMGGAASVFGAFESLGRLQPKVNVVGVVPAVMNMPGGDAYRPGDILTSLSGQTIEVLNTDAEGRLILCDALTYTERFKPASVVDIATLTGACVVALGGVVSGLMSQDDELADSLLAAGDTSYDRAWRLPLWEEYQEQLASNFADMANVGSKEGGAITAACFLSRYTRKYRWAHLDVAGTAWLGGRQKGATGRPVPLLVQYLLDQSS